MQSISIALMISLMSLLANHTIAQDLPMNNTRQSEEIVRSFLQIVRSGKDPEKASVFMSDTVMANQMNAENPETIKRTPRDYADHIRDFIRLYGHYDFEIEELIARDNKVYARWKQTGRHLADIGDYKATGFPLTEIGSAVYRVENDKIVEYWIQVDREGFNLQLQQNKIKWQKIK